MKTSGQEMLIALIYLHQITQPAQLSLNFNYCRCVFVPTVITGHHQPHNGYKTILIMLDNIWFINKVLLIMKKGVLVLFIYLLVSYRSETFYD